MDFLQSTLNDLLTAAQVLEYCEHHRGEALLITDAESQDAARRRTNDISGWDESFITAVDEEMLFEIILAANYLDIKPLLSVLLNITLCHS
jgi:hypothetical protein